MCYLPLWIKVSHTGLSIISALGAGLMVGAAFTVVIPESISDALSNMECEGDEAKEMEAYRLIGICLTVGFCFMMIVDSLTHKCSGHSHSHSHEKGCDGHEEGCNGHEEGCNGHEEGCNGHEEGCNGHEEGCDNHEEKHAEGERSHKEEVNHRHSYQATVWGLCLHSIFDGVAIGASMLAKESRTLWIIFFAIVLHKSAAAFGLGAYFKKLALTVKESTLYVMIFASTTPIATFVVALIVKWGTSLNRNILPVAFAFSAGTFLYVAITHIVPEIGSNLKAWHLLAMLVGILLPYFLFIDADSA